MDKQETHGKDMHYPSYHISKRTLKRWAATAKTPEERKAYTSYLRKQTNVGTRGKARTKV